MSLSFSRSLRSLQLDSFRATRVALVLALVNMCVLLGWFFLAHVTLYEVGSNLAWQDEGMLAATFSKEALARLRQGQTARVCLDLGANQPGQTYDAYVYRLPESGEQVLFYIARGDLPDEARQGKVIGQVDVAVEKITPAELVLRTSGKFLSSPPAASTAATPQAAP